MKKVILTYLLLSLFFIQMQGQQLPIFTQYRENQGYINPASLNSDYFAYEHNMSVGASHRSQWVGFEGSPTTQTVRVEYLSQTNNSFELLTGGYIMKDEADPMGMTGVYGRLGAVLTDGDAYYGGLSVGLTVGLVQYRTRIDKLNIRDAQDVSADNQQKLFPDVGMGIYYYKRINRGDFFYAGASVPQVFGLDLTYDQGNDNEFSIQRIQHVYGLLGYYKYINEDSFIEFSAWPKYAPNVPFHVDANVRYQMSSTVWVGSGLSSIGSLHLECGIVLGYNVGLEESAFRIGYGYDHTFKAYAIPGAFGASHEINVTYSFITN